MNWKKACMSCGLAISHGLECPALKSDDPLVELKKLWENIHTAELTDSAVLSQEMAHKAAIYCWGEEMYQAIKRACDT